MSAAGHGTLVGMATADPLELVEEALARPFVQAMPTDRRAMLEEDLRACAARVAEGAPYALFREAVEHRMWAEEHADELDDLTPEEIEEIERRSAEAVAHPERLIPWEAVFPPQRLTGTG